MEIVIMPVVREGIFEVDYATTDGSDLTIPDNDGNVTIEFFNPTDFDLHFTPVATFTLGGETFPSIERTVSPHSGVRYGPYPPATYNNDDGTVTIQAEVGLQVRGQRI